MIRKTALLTVLLVSLAACSETTKVSDDLADSQSDQANPTGRTEQGSVDPGERAVLIGEGGSRFDACPSVGRITSVELEVLASPFDSAKVKDKVGSGQMVYICNRSLDQKWFGIVYDKAATPLPEGGEDVAAVTDCGVSSPVRSKRNYDGPCKSGWVESSFVKLVAG